MNGNTPRVERRLLPALFVLALTMSVGIPSLNAQIPRLFSWQGVLLDQFGAPVADGTWNVTLRLYDVANGGTPIWEESEGVVTFDGVFTALLGDQTPLTATFDRPYWLALELQGEQEMTPRIPLVSVPYALNALTSDSARVASRALIADSIVGGTGSGVRSINALAGRLHLVGRGGTTVAIAGDTLLITSGGDQLPANASEGDIVRWDAPSNSWIATGLTVSTTPRLSGDGSAADPLDIARMGATEGEFLQWSDQANTWVPASATFSIRTEAPLTGDGSAAAPLALAAGTVAGQGLFWNGSSWEFTDAAPPAAGDALLWDGARNIWSPGGFTVATTSRLSGNGTTADPLDIARLGADHGQALLWDTATGAWRPGSPFLLSRPPFTGNGSANAPLSLIEGTQRSQILYWDGTIWKRSDGDAARAGEQLVWDQTRGWVPGPVGIVDLMPLTEGSLWVGGANDTATTLPIGSADNILGVRPDGSGPAWLSVIRPDSLLTDGIVVGGDGVISGDLTVGGTDVTLPNGTIDNVELANSAIGVAYGAGLAGDATVALGDTLQVRNTGVVSAQAGRGITLDSATGAVTITNDGLLGARSGDGVDVTITNDTAVITNTGVRSIAAGDGIAVDSATGAVTVTNTGVTLLRGTINQVVASDSTGAITLSLPQDIHTDASPTFDGLTLDNIDTASTADQVVVSNNGAIESRSFTSFFPGGLLPSGVTQNSTLRWNGSAWVENGAVRGDSLGNVNADGDATIGGDLTVGGTDVTLPNGTIDNVELANSAIGVAYGAGLAGDATVALGDTLQVRNTGVVSAQAGRGITLDSATGAVTITNDGLLGARSGDGVDVTITNDTAVITNTGVRSIAAGDGIAVDSATGAVTVTNTGVTLLRGTINQVVASDSTGAITLSLPQNIDSSATPYFNGITLGNLDTTSLGTNLLVSNGGAVEARTLSSVVDSIGGGFWRTTGNSGTDSRLNFLGTVDSTALVFRVDNRTAFRLIPGQNPSVIGGAASNFTSGNPDGVVIAGGRLNGIDSASDGSTIGGGAVNRVEQGVLHGTIAGGQANVIESGAWNASILGGELNRIKAGATSASITGGSRNTVGGRAVNAVVSGGINNRIDSGANGGVVGGGLFNRVDTGSSFATIGGGSSNLVGTNAFGTTIAGGTNDTIGGSSSYAAIAGGRFNVIDSEGSYSAIGGGQSNRIDLSAWGTIAGGRDNTIDSADYSAILGGRGLTLRGDRSVGFLADDGATPMTIDSSDLALFGNTDLWLANNNGQASAIRLFEPNGTTGNFPGTTHYTSFEADSQAANIVYLLPDTAGVDGDVLTVRSVSGERVTLDWGAGGGGSGWDLTGNAGTNPATNFLGTTDNQPLVVRVNNDTAFRIVPHNFGPILIGGHRTNSVESDSWSATIGGGIDNTIGSDNRYSTIGGGRDNSISNGAYMSTIAGGNVLHIGDSAESSTIAGGSINQIGSFSSYSVISGGLNNFVASQSPGGGIGGGSGNRIGQGAEHATISGGKNGEIGLSAPYSVIAGGDSNVVQRLAAYSIVVGGRDNKVDTAATYSALGGGTLNRIGVRSTHSVIDGGWNNEIEASNQASTIGGGSSHVIEENGLENTIGGGTSNTIADSTNYGTIGGGWTNDIGRRTVASTIGGGRGNEIDSTAREATIGGGVGNWIGVGTDGSTVGGGTINTIYDESDWSTIGGGFYNTIDTLNASSTIAGGRGSTIGRGAITGVIAGGDTNAIGILSWGSTVAGGRRNAIADTTGYSTIGGGLYNHIDRYTSYATIVGGYADSIGENADNSTILGGFDNAIGPQVNGSTIAGGVGLRLDGSRSFGFHANSVIGSKDMTIDEAFVAVLGNVDLWLANNNNIATGIRFYEPYNTAGDFPGPSTNRAYYTSFQAPALTDTIRYVLPATKGTAGDVLEIANVTGDSVTLEWDTDDDSSDERFKRNIRTLSGALDSTLLLRGVRHDWRRDEFENRSFPETESIGFIAQEVEEVFPELVETESDGYKKVKYAKVTALLVEAMRQQQEQIDAQSEEIALLRQLLEELLREHRDGRVPDAR